MAISKSDLEDEYKSRINRVFEYIDENLMEDLSLETISKIAFFSPYHFHRIFKTITGETLNEYITRQRIEKAAAMLLYNSNSRITEIAFQFGFSENSAFTRAFKKFYQLSPTAFREQHTNKFSKINQLKSKNGQAYPSREQYLSNIDNLKNWIKMNAKIEVKEMPKMELAYITCIGDKNVSNAFDKLVKWAMPKGLLAKEETKMVTIYHDSFKITEPEKVRMSACILLTEPVETEGEIGLTTIEAGKFIKGSFEINLSDFEQAWSGLFIWMNENGYKKADRNPFEIFHNNYQDHPEKKCIVDLYIPIE